MANAKKCDRCGGFYTPGYEIPDMRVAYPDEAFCTKYYDLCDNCTDDLALFMTGCVVDVNKEINNERSEEM